MTTVTYSAINTGTNLKRDECLEKYYEIKEIIEQKIAELVKTDGENSEFVEKCKAFRKHLADTNNDYSECFNYKDGLPYGKAEDLVDDSLKKSTHYGKCLTLNLESTSKDKAEEQKAKSPEQEEGSEESTDPPREAIQAQSRCPGNSCVTEHQSGHELEGEKQIRSGESGPTHDETPLDSPSKITVAHSAESGLSSTPRDASHTSITPGAGDTATKDMHDVNQLQIDRRGDFRSASLQDGKINFHTDDVKYVKGLKQKNFIRIDIFEDDAHKIIPDNGLNNSYKIVSDNSRTYTDESIHLNHANQDTFNPPSETPRDNSSIDQMTAYGVKSPLGERSSLKAESPPRNPSHKTDLLLSPSHQSTSVHFSTSHRADNERPHPIIGISGITGSESHIKSSLDGEQVSIADSDVNERGIVFQNPDLPTTAPESGIYSFKTYIIIGVSILAILLLIALLIRVRQYLRIKNIINIFIIIFFLNINI